MQNQLMNIERHNKSNSVPINQTMDQSATKEQDVANPYDQKHLLSSSKQAALVADYANQIQPDEYLNDNELNFLQHLAKNEALLEYFHQLQEGLCSLFTQSKIANGKFKIDGSTKGTTALQAAGELIPAVGDIMKGAAKGMNFMNEREIRTKLSKIS